jgi:hypothetical protein
MLFSHNHATAIPKTTFLLPLPPSLLHSLPHFALIPQRDSPHYTRNKAMIRSMIVPRYHSVEVNKSDNDGKSDQTRRSVKAMRRIPSADN